jgi:hypothetical protein
VFGDGHSFTWHGCFAHVIELTTGVSYKHDEAKHELKNVRDDVCAFSSSTYECSTSIDF